MITGAQGETSRLDAACNLGYVWLILVVAAMGGLPETKGKTLEQIEKELVD